MKISKETEEALKIIEIMVRQYCAYGHHYVSSGSHTNKKALQLLCKHGKMIYKPWKDIDGYEYEAYYFTKKGNNNG